MDSFYSSVALCERLLAAQTNICGTLRKDGGEPRIIRELKNLRAGETGVRHNGRVMVVAWQAKRLVKMVKTSHQDRTQRVNMWQKGHSERVSQFKPGCVVQYSSCTNGVDKLDQNIA